MSWKRRRWNCALTATGRRRWNMRAVRSTGGARNRRLVWPLQRIGLRSGGRCILPGAGTRPNGCSRCWPRKVPDSRTTSATSAPARPAGVMRPARAKPRESCRSIPNPGLPGYRTLWRARLAAVLGERQRAVDLLREALAQGAILGIHIHQSPHFESVREYPPFQALVKPKD